MKEELEQYGPELVIEPYHSFLLRKFKKETAYFYLIYTIPIFSYEIVKGKFLEHNLNMHTVFKNSMLSLLLLGPIYGLLSSFFFYSRKESHWDKLEKQKFKLVYVEEFNQQNTHETIK